MFEHFFKPSFVNSQEREQGHTGFCMPPKLPSHSMFHQNLGAMANEINCQASVQPQNVVEVPRGDGYRHGNSHCVSHLLHREYYSNEIEGEIKVPCLAVGAPKEHNFENAYFVFKNFIKHGEELLCSHPACRNNGVQFLYCHFCKIPVAKRSFAKNHAHVNEDISDPAVSREEENIARRTEDLCSKALSGSKRKRDSPPRHHSMSTKVDETITIDPPSPATVAVASEDKNELLQCDSQSLFDACSRNKPRIAKDSISEAILSNAENYWMSLLEQRPPSEDVDGVYVWLNKVVNIAFNDQTPKQKASPGSCMP